MRKITFLSSFFIKVFAIIFMTFDHVGLFLQMLYQDKQNVIVLSDIFRDLGRLALPLFIFMIVEGVLHTHNFKKYLLRLGILASLITIPFIVLEYSHEFSSFSTLLRAGNIFLDLLLAAIAVYFLKQPNKKLKLLTLLPLAFSILSFIVKGIEESSPIDIHWFPCFLTMQYDWLAIVLAIGFYSSYLLADLYIKYIESVSGLNKEAWVSNGNYRLLVNIISLVIATIIHIFYYLFVYFWPEGVFWNASSQVYAIFSGAFILLYSGKRGYNAKWFQYGSYLYYPLHLIALAIVFIIINGGL